MLTMEPVGKHSRMDVAERTRARVIALLTAATVAASGGCVSSDPGCPRARLGSIPFPGLFTLYAVADPEHLGTHRYEAWWESPGGPDETARGILYTCRAGFLDLSHIREYTDWVRYVYERARQRLEPGAESTSTFACTWSQTRYEFVVRRPPWLDELPDPERQALVEESASRFAQRAAIIVATWHEVGTWHGQQTVPPISEKDSAFTWDDSTSHVVAASIGARALASAEPWNVAVTRALEEELAVLKVVSAEEMGRAVRLVRGRWIRGGEAVRRDLQTGLDTGVKRPWLAPGTEVCAGESAALLPVADLKDVFGRDMRGVFEVWILPPTWMTRKALGCDQCPRAINGETQLAPVLERLREEIRAIWGEDADQP